MEIHIHLNLMSHSDSDVCSNAQTTTDEGLLATLTKQMQLQSIGKTPSTMRNYATAINSLKSFLGSEILLATLDQCRLSGYEHWLRNKGICLNTVSCYMRSLRALLKGCGVDTQQLFASVFTGGTKTEKRSVDTQTIIRLRQLSLPDRTFLAMSRDVFLFCFYAMGMPFVDLAHLRKTQVSGNNIIYNRQKTGQRICVALEQPMTEILHRYMTVDSPYLFPLLKVGTDKEYRTLLGRYNRALHRLESLLGTERRLTSYVTRHSWASLAYRENVDLPVISKALGHSNTKTTMTYIREIDDQQLVLANRNLISKIAFPNAICYEKRSEK